MRLHVFQHVPFEGPGSIQGWADNANLETRVTRFFHNEPLPLIQDSATMCAATDRFTPNQKVLPRR
jgi:GMP synthase (glutamine-hydrolysing)